MSPPQFRWHEAKKEGLPQSVGLYVTYDPKKPDANPTLPSPQRGIQPQTENLCNPLVSFAFTNYWRLKCPNPYSPRPVR